MTAPRGPAVTLGATLAALALGAGLAAPARAQQKGFQAHLLEPVLDGIGVQTTDSPEVLQRLTPYFGLLNDRAINPVENASDDRGRLADVVRYMDTVTIAAAFGLPGDLEVGVGLPYVLRQSGRSFVDPTLLVEGSGVSDLRLELKWKALVAMNGQLGVGLKPFLTVPLGSAERFRGHGDRWTGGATVLAEVRFERVRLLLDAGYRKVEGNIEFAEVQDGDRAILRGAAAVTVYRQGGYDIDPTTEKREFQGYYRLDAEASLDASFRPTRSEAATSPVLLLFGLRLDTPIRVQLTGGGGVGLTSGIGAPDYLFYIGLGFTYEPRHVESWRIAEGGIGAGD